MAEETNPIVQEIVATLEQCSPECQAELLQIVKIWGDLPRETRRGTIAMIELTLGRRSATE